jgi:hypothetical protein
LLGISQRKAATVAMQRRGKHSIPTILVVFLREGYITPVTIITAAVFEVNAETFRAVSHWQFLSECSDAQVSRKLKERIETRSTEAEYKRSAVYRFGV